MQLLYQSMKDPCFTTYFYDWYVVAVPYANFLSSSVCTELPGAPECFFILLNQCDYFKVPPSRSRAIGRSAGLIPIPPALL